MQNLQPAVRRRRIYKGRSKLGCRNCKQKHIRCDEAQPHCKNCFKSGLRCDGPIPPPSTASNPTSPRLGFHTAAETIQLFVSEFVPMLGGSQSHNFWVESVCPMAEYNPGIQTAVMALSTLWDIPQSQILLASQFSTLTHSNSRYQDALEWYDRSVSLSKNSMREIPGDGPETIIESLVLTILYMHIEYRLGNRANTERLAITAFAVIDSFSLVLETIEDPRLIAILLQLLRFPAAQRIDCMMIPQEHHFTVTSLASKLLSNTDPSDTLIRLSFELINISWDINDISNGFLPVDPSDPAIRLEEWYQKYSFHHQALSTPPFPLDLLYYTTQVRWHVHLHGLYSYRQPLEIYLSQVLDIITRLTQYTHSGSQTLATSIVNSFVVPLCIFVAWHWREDTILARISTILSSLRVEREFVRLVASYIEILVTADYHEGTTTEIRLFGQPPRILEFWQIQDCCWDLLRHSGLAFGK